MNQFLSTATEVLTAVGWKALRLLPLLAVSIPVAVYLNHAGFGDRVRKVVERGPLVSILLATLVGALSPLCSCGVIPVVTALLASGMPLAPVMSFWLASPSMDPEILLVSSAAIGWELAVWRLAATFVMSFGAGLIVMLLEKRNVFAGGVLRADLPVPLPVPEPNPVPETKPGQDISPLQVVPLAATAAGASAPGVEVRVDAQRPVIRFRGIELKPLLLEAARTGGRLLALMVLAFVLEEVVTRTLPVQAVATALGTQARWAVPLATLVGIPLYATNLTALGLVAGLIGRGMDPAAALSFFVAGAVTTVPAISAVIGIVRGRVFALYLAFALVGALGAGYLWKFVHAFSFD